MNLKTDCEKGKIKITYLSKEDRRYIKEIRKEMKKFEKSLKEHISKHRKEMILNALEKGC